MFAVLDGNHEDAGLQAGLCTEAAPGLHLTELLFGCFDAMRPAFALCPIAFFQFGGIVRRCDGGILSNPGSVRVAIVPGGLRLVLRSALVFLRGGGDGVRLD